MSELDSVVTFLSYAELGRKMRGPEFDPDSTRIRPGSLVQREKIASDLRK